jgi:hypothetical protein
LKPAQPGETPEIKATLAPSTDEQAREQTDGPWEKGQWKLPPGVPKARGHVLSVQRVEPLMIDGENINVIVEEFRGESDGPAKEIQLRILKPAEPGTPVYADPAEGEKARQQAEEARERAEEAREDATAVDEAKELLPSERHDLQKQLQRMNALQEAERAFVESDRKLAALRALAEKTKNVMSPGHPKIREAEERLRGAEQEHERRLLLLQAIKAHPESPPEEITREIDALLEDRGGKPETDEAVQRLQEIQRHFVKPTELERLINESESHLRHGNVRNAARAAEEALGKDPENAHAKALHELAQRMLREGTTHEALPESDQRLQEMQRRLEEQQKVIEELRKKLEERSRDAVPPPYTPQSDADATADPDESASSSQSSTRSIFDEGLQLAGSFADNIPAAIDASSKTFSFDVGSVR